MSDTMANKTTNSGPRAVSTATNAKPTDQPKVKRENKPRTFYMAYQGNLTAEPIFVFDKDELVDMLTNNRDVQVKRITVPVSKRSRQQGADPTLLGADAAGAKPSDA